MIKNLIAGYIENLTSQNLYESALKQGINLSEEELNFSYNFLKNNYDEVLKNPAHFDFNQYAGYYSEENFIKINNLINKYRHYIS